MDLPPLNQQEKALNDFAQANLKTSCFLSRLPEDLVSNHRVFFFGSIEKQPIHTSIQTGFSPLNEGFSMPVRLRFLC